MNAFTQFLAKRAEKGGKAPLANADAPVTRAEFNTLSRAVAALIEDFDAVATPEKIAAVINEAVEEAAKAVTPTGNARDNRLHLAPSDADELVAPPRRVKTDTLANARTAARKPLALPADRSHLAPKGE